MRVRLWLSGMLGLVLLGLAIPGARATLPFGAGAAGYTIAPMLDRVTPAVVNIAVKSHTTVRNPLLEDPFFRQFFNVPDRPQRLEQLSAGSGVIIDAGRGYVVTNNHVVKGADEIMVTLKDRRRLRAKLVGSDPGTDVALLLIDADHLTELPIGDSEQLRVGDFVAAIGNPFGLGQTVTSGIVSALGRSGLQIEGYENFIQTDASINPGNSGGALVNFAGELIGINTAIIGPGGGNVGIGFAVPTSMVKVVVRQLIDHGEMRRGRLGVEVRDLTPDVAELLGPTTLPSVADGALIVKILPGSPAAEGGVRVGDVVVGIDGLPVHGAGDLRNRIGMMAIGSDVSIEVVRNGARRNLTVRIGR
ncbi:MAG: Do family serine endopeptidase [Rhodospirillaceae bacterium]